MARMLLARLLVLSLLVRATLGSDLTYADAPVPTNIDDKWGFRYGDEIVIAAQFEDLHVFSEGRAAVKLDGKWGYVDENGETKVPFLYDEAEDFEEGLAAVARGETWGVVNLSGKLVIPTTFDWVQGFSEGLSAVIENDRLNYIDRQGRQMGLHRRHRPRGHRILVRGRQLLLTRVRSRPARRQVGLHRPYR
jgi:hypothetical protein